MLLAFSHSRMFLLIFYFNTNVSKKVSLYAFLYKWLQIRPDVVFIPKNPNRRYAFVLLNTTVNFRILFRIKKNKTHIIEKVFMKSGKSERNYKQSLMILVIIRYVYG